MTSQLGNDDETYFRAHGANEVLSKPFNLLDFDAIVQAHLNSPQQQQRLLSSSRTNEFTTVDKARAKSKSLTGKPLQILVVDDSKATRYT